jgi:hypothetical protein
MGWGASTGTVAAANNKVSGTSFTTGLITCPAGDVIILVFAFDNTASTTQPVINSITLPAGETAVGRRYGTIPSATTTAGAGMRGEIFVIKTTVAWTAFQPVVTFSAAITAKASHGVCKSLSGPTRLPGPRAAVPISGGTSATSAPSNADANVQSGDLVIGLGVCQTATAMTADADTTNGSWVTEGTSGTSGGTDNTNVTLILQTKIPTATGTQTYNPTDSVSTQSGAVCIEIPATDTVAKVGRVHAEALEKPPTPDAKVGRVHVEALEKPQKPDSKVGRVHVEVLMKQPVAGVLIGRATETDTARVDRLLSTRSMLSGVLVRLTQHADH